jgi:transcriptional regulator with XRE-family HTH domain
MQERAVKQPRATFGATIRAARKAAKLTLRDVGEVVGGGPPFMHDVEHDRRPLRKEHWGALVAKLPTLSVEALAAALVETGPVTVDAREAPPTVKRALAGMLAAEVPR